MAATAVGIVRNSTFLGQMANYRLTDALSHRDIEQEMKKMGGDVSLPLIDTSKYSASHYAQEVQQIGVELMQKHMAAVDRGTPSPREIADYHYDVFRAHGLPARTFGGTPVTGFDMEADTAAFIWLSCH